MTDRIRALWFLTWVPLLVALAVMGFTVRGDWFALALTLGAAAGAWLRPVVAGRVRVLAVVEPVVVLLIALLLLDRVDSLDLNPDLLIASLTALAALAAAASFPDAGPVPARTTALRAGAAVAVSAVVAGLALVRPLAAVLAVAVVSVGAAIAHPFLLRLEARTPAPVPPIVAAPGVVDARGLRRWATLSGAVAAGLLFAETHYTAAFVPVNMVLPLERTKPAVWAVAVVLGWGVGAAVAAKLRPRRQQVPAWVCELVIAVLVIVCMIPAFTQSGLPVDVPAAAIGAATVALHPAGPLASWGERVPGRWWLLAAAGGAVLWSVGGRFAVFFPLMLALGFAALALVLYLVGRSDQWGRADASGTMRQ